MKVCKICGQTKFNFQMTKQWSSWQGGCGSKRTNLCKVCASTITDKVIHDLQDAVSDRAMCELQGFITPNNTRIEYDIQITLKR